MALCDIFKRKKRRNKSNEFVSYNTKTEDGKAIEAYGYWNKNDMKEQFDKYYGKEESSTIASKEQTQESSIGLEHTDKHLRILFDFNGDRDKNRSRLRRDVPIDTEKNTVKLDLTTGKIYITNFQGFMGYGFNYRDADEDEITYEISVEEFHRLINEHADNSLKEKFAGYNHSNWKNYI